MAVTVTELPSDVGLFADELAQRFVDFFEQPLELGRVAINVEEAQKLLSRFLEFDPCCHRHRLHLPPTSMHVAAVLDGFSQASSDNSFRHSSMCFGSASILSDEFLLELTHFPRHEDAACHRANRRALLPVKRHLRAARCQNWRWVRCASANSAVEPIEVPPR